MSDSIPNSPDEFFRKAEEARFASMERFFRFMQEEELRIEKLDDESEITIRMGLYRTMVGVLNLQRKNFNNLLNSYSDPGPT